MTKQDSSEIDLDNLPFEELELALDELVHLVKTCMTDRESAEKLVSMWTQFLLSQSGEDD